MVTEKLQYIDVLKKVPIFSAIETEKLLDLYNQCELHSGVDGELLISKDTEAAEIYIVLEGAVSVILTRDGTPFEVAHLGVGSCLGETSVIGIQNHSADVEIIGNSTFLVLTRATLMNLYSADISLFALLVLNIARELARRLKETDRYLETGG